MHNNINGMVDGDLIWESCISDDQQDFKITLDVNMVNIVGSMCDTIDHKALLVTTEPCCSFGLWRGIQCVWTTLWSRRHLAGSHFLPSPHSQSGVHKDHCCNLTDLKTWHYLICFLFHFFLFLLIFKPFEFALSHECFSVSKISQSGKSQNLRITEYVSVFSKVQIVTSQRCSRESSLCWNKLSKQ